MSVPDRSKRAARHRTRLVLVTGMSGAGKSTVMKAFEDIGYEAVDNPPLPLLASLVAPDASRGAALAVDIDVRTRDFSAAALRDAVAPIFARDDVDARLLFVDCEDEVLRRRFTETRRRHPLADDRPVIDGIRHERGLIEGLRAHADLTFDTTELGVAELRRLVAGHFALDDRPTLTISVMSFSYAHGLPREADLVFDVRFLANPHYVDDLRPLTGRDAAVGAYIAQDPGYQPFFDSLAALLVPLLPRFEGEGKSYLTIAVGCTGGRHRSVHVAERIAELLGAEGRKCHLRHRDLARDPGL